MLVIVAALLGNKLMRTPNAMDKEVVTRAATRYWRGRYRVPGAEHAALSIGDKNATDCGKQGSRVRRGARGYPALVVAAAWALSSVCGYSQRQPTTVHFGCSPTHWAT